jgi:hypothetical protein
MARGHLASGTEEQDFQTWLANNWNRPLSDEVARLQGEVNRLDARHAITCRPQLKAESEWWSLARKGFLVTLVLVALLLWHMNSYLEARGALKEVCAFIAREVSARVKGDSAMPFAGDLEDANNVCHERGILP